MIQTPICDLLGIQYPVFQGGMAWIADGKLAAAVSEGGGLGIIAAGNAPAQEKEPGSFWTAHVLTPGKKVATIKYETF